MSTHAARLDAGGLLPASVKTDRDATEQIVARSYRHPASATGKSFVWLPIVWAKRKTWRWSFWGSSRLWFPNRSPSSSAAVWGLLPGP